MQVGMKQVAFATNHPSLFTLPTETWFLKNGKLGLQVGCRTAQLPPSPTSIIMALPSTEPAHSCEQPLCYKHKSHLGLGASMGYRANNTGCGAGRTGLQLWLCVTQQGSLNLSVPKIPHPQDQAHYPDSTY